MSDLKFKDYLVNKVFQIWFRKENRLRDVK